MPVTRATFFWLITLRFSRKADMDCGPPPRNTLFYLDFIRYAGYPPASAQCRGQFVAQIAQVLDTDRQTNQPIADAQPLSIGRRNRGVGHDRRMLDQTLHATERFCQREELAAFEHTPGFAQPTLDLYADDAAE